jgi:hypothetical protein
MQQRKMNYIPIQPLGLPPEHMPTWAAQGRSGSFSAWLALSRYNLLIFSARTREYFSSPFGYTECADPVTG